jgi:predicted phage terminase large subunit-like protein
MSLDSKQLDGEGLHCPPVARVAGDVLTAAKLATARRPIRPRGDEPQRSTLAWGRTFLPAHFAQPPSAMHDWLGDELDRFRIERGRKINLIGPRGAAKSTIGSLCHVLRSAVEAAEPYIWIVSDTKHQAQTHLENVKLELVENERLAARYPYAVGRGTRWQATAIELRNGVVIESFGTGQRIRGRRRHAHRPTLIVCDDLQNDSHISSALQRENSSQWFHGTLLKAGTKRTHIVNLATALHRDALALQLHRTAGWTSKVFKAIERWPVQMELWHEWQRIYTNADDPRATARALEFYLSKYTEMNAGAVLLWPAEDDLYTLMRMRVESGHAAFEREKQSSPVDPHLCEWPETYFDDHIWFDDWPEPLLIKTMALDPSKGRDARRGDYSALVVVGIDTAGIVHVEANLARRPTPEIVEFTAQWCREQKPLALGVEANQFQELLAGELAAEFRRQGIHLVPCAIHNYVSKHVRIRRLGPYLSQRRLRFQTNCASTRLLVDQLRDFPIGAHDDGPDALEMAIRLAEQVWQGRHADDGLGNRLNIQN